MAFILATAVTTTAADLADLTKAKVVRIKGSARYTTGTGSWQPLKVGDILLSGTVLQTAADSRVDLILGDPEANAVQARPGMTLAAAAPAPTEGSGASGDQPSRVDQNFVRLMENTVLSVDKLAATDAGADIITDTQLDLRAGRIFGTVKKLSGGSKYEIKIPNGVAGIRGTIYEIDSTGFAKVYLEGALALALSFKDEVRTKLVRAGQQYDPETDKLTSLNSDQAQEMDTNVQAASQVKKGPPGPPPPGQRPPNPPHNPQNPHVGPEPPMSPNK